MSGGLRKHRVGGPWPLRNSAGIAFVLCFFGLVLGVLAIRQNVNFVLAFAWTSTA